MELKLDKTLLDAGTSLSSSEVGPWWQYGTSFLSVFSCCIEDPLVDEKLIGWGSLLQLQSSLQSRAFLEVVQPPSTFN